MRAGRQEVTDILRRWRDESLWVRWAGSFATFAFASVGQIVSISEKEIRLASRDKRSELVLRLSAEMHFEYADSRVVSGNAKKYEECVMLFLANATEESEPDSISLAAFRDYEDFPG